MAHISVTPIYENTTMEAYYNSSNVLRSYYIAPVEGYALHASRYDFEEFDEETGEPTGNIIEGFTTYSITVGFNYDFETNPENIYAKPIDDIPENQIFNNGQPEHEVM